MLTVEETGWSLSWFKVFSNLNILPIEVDVKSGRIQRQSSKIRVFMWKILFGGAAFHWIFMFARLVQSTVIEPEKYFRWDHFVFHFGLTFGCAVFYFTGFRLFVKTPEETVIIFNEIFVKREDPIQKMMNQLQLKAKPKNENQGNEKRVKSGTGLVSSSARESHEEIELEVTENQSKSEVCPRPRPLLTWPPQYSLDELVAKLFPSVGVPSTYVVMVILALDPSRPQLFYSALPPEHQNLWSLLILLVVETIFFYVFVITISFAIVTQVLFFRKVQLEFKRKSLQLSNLEEKFQSHSLENRGREFQREIWILRQILKEMRELVFFIELFNRCFPFCIFAWKLCCLSLSIMFYFFLIRHVQDFPLLGLFMGYIAILLTFVYTVMYAHAFSIPGKMDDLKNEFLLTAQKTTTKVSTSTVNFNGNKILWPEMKREIKRIRGVGIKVGSFHQMERESTPNFVNFVVNQVVSLLVTFPR